MTGTMGTMGTTDMLARWLAGPLLATCAIVLVLVLWVVVMRLVEHRREHRELERWRQWQHERIRGERRV